MPKLSLAVVSSAFSTDPRQAMPRARAAGFRGVQFDARAAALDLTTLSQSGRREFRTLLATHEQQLAGIRTDAGPKGFAPKSDIDRALAGLDKVLEAAAGLQAPLACLDLGPMPEPAVSAAKPKPKVDPAQAGLIILPESAAGLGIEVAPAPEARPADSAFESSLDAALVALGQLADRYGVTVALRSELASYAALERALKAAGCPWFGVDLDATAVLRDRWPAEEVFGRLGSEVRHVRVRDARVGHDRRTQPAAVGQGDTNWGQLTALLDEAGYHGWATVDPLELADRAGGATGAVKHLKQFGV
ncbi:MAG TPA: TIM barrel protein [Tepidisphaeraceae bacterium]|nr:TIM barrel protein [Tepidisphaeraceae bacterium]